MSHQGIETVLTQMRSIMGQVKTVIPKTNQGDLLSAGIDSKTQASFQDVFKQALSQVSQDQHEAYRLQHAFQTGDPDVHLSEVMLGNQKAQLGFQALVQVRNKCLDAYRDLMNTPV